MQISESDQYSIMTFMITQQGINTILYHRLEGYTNLTISLQMQASASGTNYPIKSKHVNLTHCSNLNSRNTYYKTHYLPQTTHKLMYYIKPVNYIISVLIWKMQECMSKCMYASIMKVGVYACMMNVYMYMNVLLNFTQILILITIKIKNYYFALHNCRFIIFIDIFCIIYIFFNVHLCTI